MKSRSEQWKRVRMKISASGHCAPVTTRRGFIPDYTEKSISARRSGHFHFPPFIIIILYIYIYIYIYILRKDLFAYFPSSPFSSFSSAPWRPIQSTTRLASFVTSCVRVMSSAWHCHSSVIDFLMAGGGGGGGGDREGGREGSGWCWRCWRCWCWWLDLSTLLPGLTKDGLRFPVPAGMRSLPGMASPPALLKPSVMNLHLSF